MADVCLICPGCGYCVQHAGGCQCPTTTTEKKD